MKLLKTHDFLDLNLDLKHNPYIGETHSSMELKSVPPPLPDNIKDTPTQLKRSYELPLDLSQSQIKY